MCGIFGYIDPNGLTVESDQLRIARDSLTHRGPDSFGEYQDATTYLGFRRLAILDLSPEGNQPMVGQGGNVWIVFNGEIYNYIELRQELENKGFRFLTRTDTEVLLHLYSDRGCEMFSALNGMFAIALYDRKKGIVILARDRLGKKPFFYWYSGGKLAFASEIRALRRLPAFPSGQDPESVGLYLRLGWVPGWTCIFPGVRKLPPASWVQFDISRNQLSEPKTYWMLPSVEVDEGITEEAWLDRIEDLLLNATRIRLRSDVPLGTFLSGGVDSGLVTAAASRLAGGNLTSLTIGFPGWEEDEWPIARQCAKFLGIQAIHRELAVEGTALLPAVFAHFDEPFADGSALPTSLVCEAAREHLTVALSGDGGDELFGGYGNHVRSQRWGGLDRIPAFLRKYIAGGAALLAPPDSRVRRFLRRATYPVGTWGMGGKIYPFEDWLTRCVRPEHLLTIRDMERVLSKNFTEWPGAEPIDQAQRTDIQFYLPDDILVKVDRMSMRHSLEVRSPFLDYRMVELALRLPSNFRVRGGENKYLLRKLALRHLPRSVSSAPKRGFGIPLREWLLNSAHTPAFREAVSSAVPGVPDPLLSGKGSDLWSMAERNKALVPALFRVLVYRWWSQGLTELA